MSRSLCSTKSIINYKSVFLFLFLIFLYNLSFSQFGKNQLDSDWRVYASSNYSTKYTPLKQINANNFKNLKIAWRWSSVDQPLLDADSTLRTWKNESTPLKIGNVLYTSTSLSQVAAINAKDGTTIWQYNPGTYKNSSPPNLGFVNRGLAYWEKSTDKRVYIATADAYLIALDCTTGKPVETFGDNGRIDLTKGFRREVDRRYYGVTSPPLICNDIIVIGANILDFPMTDAMPPGDVRGFDAKTGKLLWTFKSIPQNDEFGSNTWENNSWKNMGNTNVWTWMSCDETLGYVYLPFGTPSNDFYGGQRPGDNLFGESIVALDVKTGKRVWHYQTVHHGLWDYDLPAAPTLADLTVNDEKRKILVQVTKQGFVFILDRVTGKPIWTVEEKSITASHISGEKTAATQPFPTNPKPFDRQGIDTNDLIDFTPELKLLAKNMLNKYDYGSLFTPPSEKGTVILPGNVGGASWSGAAYDPVKGVLYVPSVTKPAVLRLFKTNPDDSSSYLGYFSFDEFTGPANLPLVKPPYGRITAIDVSTGNHLWMQPIGNTPANHPLLKSLKLINLGSPNRNHILLTQTLLFAAAEGSGTYRPSPFRNGVVNESKTEEPYLRAFNPQDGKLVGEILLPTNANGAPITYTLKGKQYIVIPIGGASQKAELIALTLPENKE